MKRAQISQAYRAAKSSGTFNLNPTLDNGTCKSDPYKLCAWKVRRSSKLPDVHGIIQHAQRKRAQRIIQEHIQQRTNQQHPPGSREQALRRELDEILTTWMHKDPRVIASDSMEHLAKRFLNYTGLAGKIKIRSILGKGTYGKVFHGLWKNATGANTPCAVKFVHIKNNHDVWAFLNEVDMQRKLYDTYALRRNIPKIYDAHIVKHDRVKIGVVIMQYVDITLHSLLSQRRNDPAFIRQCAKSLKEMLGRLWGEGYSHGDPHPSNIAFVKDSKKLMLIDFGYTHQGPPYIDELVVWAHSMYRGENDSSLPLNRPWNRALHVTKFPPIRAPYASEVPGEGRPSIDHVDSENQFKILYRLNGEVLSQITYKQDMPAPPGIPYIRTQSSVSTN
jgi:hypothetical protein